VRKAGRGRRRLLVGAAVVALLASAGCSSAWMHPALRPTAGAPALAGNPLTTADPAPRTSGASTAVVPTGGSAGNGAVHVDVPAGVVPAGHTFSVPATSAIPPQVGEVFGQPAGVEHDAPLAGPVTVRWTLPQLSPVQRDSIVLAKWDPAAKVWVGRPDVPFQVTGSTLTARLTDFSFWDWVANAGQKVGEWTGSRKDGPTCAKNGGKDDHLPDWVKNVVNPSQGTSAAAIRVCFEADHGDLVTVRVVNNRPFTQQLHMTTGGQQWAWTWPGPEAFDVDASIALLAHAALDTGTTYVIPPLGEVAVGIDRPGTPGQLVIAAQAQVNLASAFVDLVRFAMDQQSVGGFENPAANALVQAVYECGGKRMLGRPDLHKPSEIAASALDILHSCADAIADPESEFGKRFAQLTVAALEKAGKTDVAAKAKRLAGEAHKAFKLLTIGEVAFYVSDQLQNAVVGPLTLSIRGDGRAQAVGAWTPSCTDTKADSNALYKNLALQDEFSDKSKELWQFPQWAGEAARAIAPLSTCSSSYLAKLATELPGGWQDKKAAGVVADAVRRLGADWQTVRFDGIGDLTLSMTVADLTARGYTNGGNIYEGMNAACVSYGKKGVPVGVTVDTASGRVVGLRAGNGQAHTQVGNIRAGSTLAQVRKAFSSPGYSIETKFGNDFGQGANGVIVHGPSGAGIGMSVDGDAAALASGTATVSGVTGVGTGTGVPSAMETGC
jgi:hypothetical protein